MTLNEFLAKTPIGGERLRPEIVCNDGFKMSVQGSESHYSNPRKTSITFFEMEIGFPSQTEELLLPYAEDQSDPTGTVYPYVPISIIEQVIANHGGINTTQTMKTT